MAQATLDMSQIIYCQPVDPSRNITVTGSEAFGQLEGRWVRVIRSIQLLASLNDDWDGLGAIAPSLGVVKTAIQVAHNLRKVGFHLPDSAVATPAGSVLFGWELDDGYFEVEVISANLIEWMEIDHKGVATHGSTPWRDITREANRFGG